MVLEGRPVLGSCLSCIFLFLSTFPGDIVAESLEDVTDLHYDDDDNTNLHLQLQG